MKNSQKGFVIPLLITIIILTLLGIGGWKYVYNQKTSSPNTTEAYVYPSDVNLPRGVKSEPYSFPLTVAITKENVSALVDTKSLPSGLSIVFKGGNCIDGKYPAPGGSCAPTPYLEGTPIKDGKYSFVVNSSKQITYHIQIGF
jgi:hypothetical protein